MEASEFSRHRLVLAAEDLVSERLGQALAPARQAEILAAVWAALWAEGLVGASQDWAMVPAA